MKESIIILGAGVMQGPAIRIAKELGFYAIALDADAGAPCVNLCDRFEQIDLKDKEGIEAFALAVRNKIGLGGIMTAGTDFSASVAWVAERLGLPGIPYEAALNASDKSRMRGCFEKAGLPSPKYVTITDSTDLGSLAMPGDYPLVIKPVDNMGARGCRRLDSFGELQKAAAVAIRFSRSGRAILESYMPGPEFSLDAVIYHGEITICGNADRHIFFPPYFIEMGHTMPSCFDSEKQNAVIETFCDGIHALGLAGQDSAGAAKGDIKLTEKGPMIGEIAARLSGGFMSGWTYPYSSGVEPVRGAVLAAMGRKPDLLEPVKSWTSAERAFISIPGTVKTIEGADEVRKMDHIKEFYLRVKPGDKVVFPENNVTKCGNVISAAGDRETAVQAAESAARRVYVRLAPDDPQTGDFLAHRTNEQGGETFCFPPDAFPCTAEIMSSLNQLPQTVIPQEARDICVVPFPALGGARDYSGRTAEECLEAVRKLTGFSLPVTAKNADNMIQAGKPFWEALIRGSYQGAVYYIDNLPLKWNRKAGTDSA